MSKDNRSWFGIKLTQKQSVSLFALALIGIFILSFMILFTFYPYISMFLFSPYYYNFEYFISMLIIMLPFILVIVAFLIICIYSLIRSRKIAKFYSEVLVTKNFKSTTTIFCPNCGNKRIKAENFCKTCGQELK